MSGTSVYDAGAAVASRRDGRMTELLNKWAIIALANAAIRRVVVVKVGTFETDDVNVRCLT